MSVGPDLERVIATWLAEEAPARAPDRILGAAARTIDRTRQRRFGARWREPMTVSPARLLAAAVVIVALAVGVGWVSRSSAGVGAPTSTPAPDASVAATPDASAGPTLESYKRARDRVCTAASADVDALRLGFARIYDPELTAEERTQQVAALEGVAERMLSMIRELRAIDPPEELTDEHATDIARWESVAGLISETVSRVRRQQYAEGEAIDRSIDPISRRIEAFEARYGLAPCP